MFHRFRAKIRDVSSPGPDVAPPSVANSAEAAAVRAALESLHRDAPERFAKRFLFEEPLLARPKERDRLNLLMHAGLVCRPGPLVHSACVRVFPIRGKFIATDLLSREDEDQVFSLMFEQVYLARNMGVRPGDDVLELCLGSGVNSLFAADVARSVTGVELSERALAFAQFNRLLNDGPSTIDFRLGSLFEPVGEREFDLILVNPPFELVPPGESWFLHSHGGPDGLDVVRNLLERAPRHLTRDGRFEIITWSPGSPGGTVLVDLLRTAFPEHHIDLRVLGTDPLETHVERFSDCEGFGDWREWLRERRYERVDFLFARVSRDGPADVEFSSPDEEIDACHAVSDRWI